MYVCMFVCLMDGWMDYHNKGKRESGEKKMLKQREAGERVKEDT